MNQLVPILGDRAPALVVAADATRAIHGRGTRLSPARRWSARSLSDFRQLDSR
jgi:hypothetical protein